MRHPKPWRTWLPPAQDGGFYTGELKSYGIVPDSERNKDFLLVNVAYKRSEDGPYVRVDADGVLLNFNFAETQNLYPS